jgi:DNA-directed RNA polymerase subunit RPC12/RpoP
MIKLIDYEKMRDLFNEKFLQTRQLILSGETHLDNLAEGFHEADRVIWEMPTIDTVEVGHGYWVDRYGGKYANPLYVCSECKEKALYKVEVDVLGSEQIVQDLSYFCPKCGARMDGGS